MIKRQTKIICTIGPASEHPLVLKKLNLAGMSVARLNCSHGDQKERLLRIRRVRDLNRSSQKPVDILLDLEGYRIRIGKFSHKTHVPLKKGQTILLSKQADENSPNIIPFDYQGPLTDIKNHSTIFIDDGNIALLVKSRTKTHLKAVVVIPGDVRERKGVNIPGFNFPFKDLTEKDEEDIRFGSQNKVEYIAQSFVRNKSDVRKVRDRVRGKNIRIIAKIENHEGIRNIDEIISLADGIMVARGDMGVSIPIYQIPMIQKSIIKKCNQRKKIVITATQMLESMTENFRPTRAEVTDVANAVLDGSDFVMLSGETAVGKHPVETVEMMAHIIRYTKKYA